MIRLIAFDLDGTLAELGKGMTQEQVELLQGLEAKGVRIAICSGKPTYYLCGFMRQIGLKQPILVGENGAVIQFGVDLPPKDFYVAKYSEEAAETIRFFSEEIHRRIPDAWYQPNMVELTPFLQRESDFPIVEECLEEMKDHIRDVSIYRFSDCYDFVPNGITKKSGMADLGNLLGITAEEMVAAGDGENDLPMFEYAKMSVGVGEKVRKYVDVCFANTTEMLKYLTEIVEKQ
ncbi:MAG: HAD family hydrolase [Schaedlerella sp.]|nr:HAD family hydrolase [Schaedlerella sp.]